MLIVPRMVCTGSDNNIIPPLEVIPNKTIKKFHAIHHQANHVCDYINSGSLYRESKQVKAQCDGRGRGWGSKKDQNTLILYLNTVQWTAPDRTIYNYNFKTFNLGWVLPWIFLYFEDILKNMCGLLVIRKLQNSLTSSNKKNHIASFKIFLVPTFSNISL